MNVQLKNNITILLIFSVLFSGTVCLANDSLAAVALAGGVIKAKNIENVKKYKRKDCPVCKGKGWYISGDGIKKVSCGYCEDDASATAVEALPLPPLKQVQDQTKTIIRHRNR
jgi:hypothetical protein